MCPSQSRSRTVCANGNDILGLGLGAGNGNALLRSKVEKVVTTGETLAIIMDQSVCQEGHVASSSPAHKKTGSRHGAITLMLGLIV